MTATSVEVGKAFAVDFIEVGRAKKSWTSQLDQYPTEAILRSLVRKSKALASREIDCDTDGTSGLVVVGGYRPVGRYEIREVTP